MRKRGKDAIAKLAASISTHAPKAAIGFEKEAVSTSRRNSSGAAGHDLFRAVGVAKGAVAELAPLIPTHRPQAAIGFEKEAVGTSRRNGSDAIGHDLFGLIGAVRGAG